MPMDLNSFASELRRGGTLPRNRYQVMISPPQVLDRPDFLQSVFSGQRITPQSVFEQLLTPKPFDDRSIALRAFNTIFPGKNLMLKDDLLRYGYGQIDKVAHGTLYDHVPVSFILDSEYNLGRSFHDWIDLISPSDSTRDGAYFVGYRDDYATEIEITRYDRTDKPVARCILHNAFPISIGDEQLAFDDQDTFAVLPVTFAYTDYTIE